MNLTTTSTFDADVLSQEGPVLVDFTADWCAPCKMVKPVLAAIAHERPDLTVLELDADANPELMRRYQVMGLPTVALFQGGELVVNLVGAKPKSKVLKEIDDALDR